MQTNSFLKIVPYVTTRNFNTNLLYLAALALLATAQVAHAAFGSTPIDGTLKNTLVDKYESPNSDRLSVISDHRRLVSERKIQMSKRKLSASKKIAGRVALILVLALPFAMVANGQNLSAKDGL